MHTSPDPRSILNHVIAGDSRSRSSAAVVAHDKREHCIPASVANRCVEGAALIGAVVSAVQQTAMLGARTHGRVANARARRCPHILYWSFALIQP